MPHIPLFVLQPARWAIQTLTAERDRRKQFIRVYGKDRGLLEFQPSPEIPRARELVREIQTAAHRFELTFRDVAQAARTP